MNNIELKDMLDKHKEWLKDNSKGKRFVLKSSADLSYADLRSADLRSADLSSADLSYANLRSANLHSADLSEIKKDFFVKLLMAKSEVKGLFDYLQKGKVDGTSYEGDCACFVGTISKIANESYENLSCGLKPESYSPIERWFLAILKGDTPSSNQVSRITCQWISEFCKEHGISLPQYKIVSSDECPEAFTKVDGLV